MIAKVQDNKTLLDVYHILDKNGPGEAASSDWFDEMSDAVKKRIKEGLSALEEGADQYLYEEFKKSIKNRFDIK